MPSDKLEENQKLVDIYRKIAERYLASSCSVLYPCCGYDISPSKVFTNVTYADQNPDPIRLIRSRGLRGVVGDVRTYTPDQAADLLILMNPQVDGSEVSSRLADKFVVCNNYHHTANQIFENSMFEFVENLHDGETTFRSSRDKMFGSFGYFLFKRKIT